MGRYGVSFTLYIIRVATCLGLFFVLLWHYFSVHHVETSLKFLTRALPAVVCPEIIGRFAAYGGLKHLEETSRYFVGRHVRRIARNEMIGGCVISSARPAHLHIEDGIVHLSHYSLASGEHRRFLMIEERQPKVDVCPLRSLVADISADVTHALSAAFHNITQRIVLRNRTAVLLMRADALEEIVECLVA